VRVAQFSWDARGRLVSVVSRAIESVLDGEAHAAPRADPPPPLPEKAAETVDEVAALRAKVAEMEAPSPQSVPRTLDLA